MKYSIDDNEWVTIYTLFLRRQMNTKEMLYSENEKEERDEEHLVCAR